MKYNKLFSSTVLVLALFVCFVNIATAQTTRIVSNYASDGYTYLVVPNTQNPPTNFGEVNFDDSSWDDGEGSFSNTTQQPGYGCPTLTTPINTEWALNSRLLTRKNVSLPSSAYNVKASFRYDNNIEKLYVNGNQVDIVNSLPANICSETEYTVIIPQNFIKEGENIFAVQAYDSGGYGFFDMKVSASVTQDNRLRGFMAALAGIDIIGKNSWKANVVRYPIYLDSLPNNSCYGDSRLNGVLNTHLDHLDSLLPAYQEHGIKLIIDLHRPSGHVTSGNLHKVLYDNNKNLFLTNQNKCRKDFKKTWQIISTRYRNNPTIWGYDLLNEPGVKEKSQRDANAWRDLAQEVSRDIRSRDTSHKIIFEPPFGKPERLDSLIRKFDSDISNVIYSVHMYNPGTFTHQGTPSEFDENDNPTAWRKVTQIIDGIPNQSIKYPGIICSKRINGVPTSCSSSSQSDTRYYFDKARLLQKLQVVRDYQTTNGVRIYIGEFSAVYFAQGSEKYIGDLVSIFEQYKWDWTYHAFRESHYWDIECRAGRHTPQYYPADPNEDSNRRVIPEVAVPNSLFPSGELPVCNRNSVNVLKGWFYKNKPF
jgi:Cellulase (glycosyl hydrolase family 5)